MPQPDISSIAGRLLELAGRVEASAGSDRELDALVAVALGAWPNTLEAEQSTTDEEEWSVVEREPDGCKVDRFSPPKVTASLDAALTLVPEGWHFHVCSDAPVSTVYRPVLSHDKTTKAHAAGLTPALALCAAALKARARAHPGEKG